MRFKAVITGNTTKIQNHLSTIKRAIENNSMTGEEVIKYLDKMIELTETNIELLEREYEQELV